MKKVLRFSAYKGLVLEDASVFQASSGKTDCGTEPKNEGLISLASFFFDRLHAPYIFVTAIPGTVLHQYLPVEHRA